MPRPRQPGRARPRPSTASASCSKRQGTTRPRPPASSRPWHYSATSATGGPGQGPQLPRRRAARNRGLPGRRRQPPAGPGNVPRIRRPARQAEALNGLGELSSRTSATGHARQYHAQALAIARDLRAPLEEARALEGLGQSHLHDGNPGQGRRAAAAGAHDLPAHRRPRRPAGPGSHPKPQTEIHQPRTPASSLQPPRPSAAHAPHPAKKPLDRQQSADTRPTARQNDLIYAVTASGTEAPIPPLAAVTRTGPQRQADDCIEFAVAVNG